MQAKPGSRRSGGTVNPATLTATEPAGRPASKALPQPDEPQRQPGPSPPKQPRAAGAQHVASSAAKQATPQQPHQEVAAPPAGKAAAATARTAATTGRADKVAGNSGQRGGASGGARQKASNSNSNPSSGKAASGGNSRKPSAAAVAGNKRSRAGSDLTNSQQQQRTSSSPPDCVPSSFASPDPASTSAGALSLPTPHRRPRLTAGLLAAAAAGGTEGRPAQTVMEVRHDPPGNYHNPTSWQAGRKTLCPTDAPKPRLQWHPQPRNRSQCQKPHWQGKTCALSSCPCCAATCCVTCLQAQERGELVQMQDDASYAMDGLAATCSIDTQRDSAVTLTEMLSTRKGRVALR